MQQTDPFSLNQQMMILGTDTVHVWCISPYLVEFVVVYGKCRYNMPV